MVPKTYTIPQFLQIFNLSRSGLYRLWDEGKGPRTIKLGRKVLISVEAAEEWAARLQGAAG